MNLYQADCFPILPTVAPSSIDLLLTDPPFGQTKLSWDQPVNWNLFWQTIYPIMKPTGIVLIFGIQPMISHVILSNPNHYRYDLIWSKTRPTGYLDANRKPLRSHEHILFFSSQFKDTIHHPQKKKTLSPYSVRRSGRGASQYANHERVSTLSDGDRYPTSVLRFPNPNHESHHPTEKPLSILTYLILTYSNPHDVILDPFMGSGSTGVAALRNYRDFIGIEKDPVIFSTASTRIYQEINQLKLPLTE